MQLLTPSLRNCIHTIQLQIFEDLYLLAMLDIYDFDQLRRRVSLGVKTIKQLRGALDRSY